VLQEVCVCIHCRRASQRALLRIRRRLQIFTPEAAGMAGCTITQDDMALLPIYRRNGMPTAVFEGFDSQTRPSSNPALATRPPCFSSEQRSAILQSCLRSLPMGDPPRQPICLCHMGVRMVRSERLICAAIPLSNPEASCLSRAGRFKLPFWQLTTSLIVRLELHFIITMKRQRHTCSRRDQNEGFWHFCDTASPEKAINTTFHFWTWAGGFKSTTWSAN
jgi:hypothetical protein